MELASTSPMPELPEGLARNAEISGATDLTTLYILEYRADGAIHHRNFVHSGGHQSAIERSKLYCKIMRYRFIFCTPFLSDFERDEKRMENFG